MNDYDAEFDAITQGMTVETPDENTPYSPYGSPVAPQKSGLTGRGKLALGMGAAVIVGGSVIGFQVHSANEAASEAKAQEIALQTQALELEKLKEMNRAAEANRKVAATEDRSRQAAIDACVKAEDDTISKSNGFARQTVVRGCQDQYPGASTVSGGGMANTASTQSAGSPGGSVNEGVLIGIGALVLGAAVVGRRLKRGDA